MKKSGLLIVSLLCMSYQSMMPASIKLSKVDQELLRAVKSYDIAGVETALAQGADPNVRDSGGWTVLMLSAFNDWILGMKLLLQAGANVGLQDLHKETALFYAKSEQAVILLIDAMCVQSELLIKTMIKKDFSKEDQREELMRLGLSIDSQNDRGFTALMMFVLFKKFDVALKIIDLGADVDMQVRNDAKALNFALYTAIYEHELDDGRQFDNIVILKIAILKKLKRTKNFEQILTSEIKKHINYFQPKPKQFVAWLSKKLDPVITKINQENKEEKEHFAQYVATLNIPNTPVEALLHNLFVTADGPIRLSSEIAEYIINSKPVEQ